MSEWHMRTAHIVLFMACLLGAGAALAVQPDVKTVPWVPGNPLVPHDTISGQPHTLKGTADVQGADFQYTWDFGDGSAVVSGTVADQYVIEAAHTYTGTPGTIFTATLTVEDTSTGESDTANYFVAIRDPALEIEVNIAIDQGLWYLHKTMARSGDAATGLGHWDQGTSCGARCASSGDDPVSAANITAFFVNGHLETGADANPYVETVQRGMRWLFTRLGTFAISNQTYDAPIGTVDPDSNGNGYGVQSLNRDPPYAGGQIMDAIVASGTPNAVTTTGQAPSGTNPGILGRTYADIIQDMVDAYAFGQSDNGTYLGGWRYGWNYFNHSDNSTNQWAAIGMIAAERVFGSTVPQFVKDANTNSVNVTQVATGTSAGQFGYTNSTSPVWGPYATTPSGGVQMVMNGIGRGDARWDRYESFMRDRFCNASTSSFPSTRAVNGIRDYYYGLFSFTKSMLLHDPDGSGASDTIDLLGGDLDWYSAQASQGDACDGVARTLVNDQAVAGYWYQNNYSSAQYPFETAWAIIMLNRTVFESGQPVAVANATPNPAVAGQTIQLSGADSFHQDPAKSIIQWFWDLDDDGEFDDAAGVNPTTSFPAVGDYPVSLRVCDDGAEQLCDNATIIVRVDTPPLAPTADANGPYVFCPAAKPWFLDGTGSVNPDEGGSEPGAPGDTIQSYEWELTGNNAFDDANGAQPDVTAFYEGLGIGDYLVQLRVTDTSATSYPSSNLAT